MPCIVLYGTECWNGKARRLKWSGNVECANRHKHTLCLKNVHIFNIWITEKSADFLVHPEETWLRRNMSSKRAYITYIVVYSSFKTGPHGPSLAYVVVKCLKFKVRIAAALIIDHFSRSLYGWIDRIVWYHWYVYRETIYFCLCTLNTRCNVGAKRRRSVVK